MINSFMMWLILGCMIVTVIPRVVPFIFVRSIELPEVVLKWLSFIPICIFTALIAEHLFIHTTTGVTIHWMYLAVLVSLVTYCSCRRHADGDCQMVFLKEKA